MKKLLSYLLTYLLTRRMKNVTRCALHSNAYLLDQPLIRN